MLALPGTVAFHIATRADCLGDDVLRVLLDVSAQIDLTVELGLQTVHDTTAALINRGHDFASFLDGYRRLREAVPRARISVHLIDGLPGEDREMMVESARSLAALAPDEVKLHLLHVIDGTRLAEMYRLGEYSPLSLEEYVSILVSQLELLSPRTVT